MALIFGRDYCKTDLLKYLGNISQIAGIEELEIAEGKARGGRIYRVKNGNGLEFDLLPDKALDIGKLSYKGVNISFQSKNNSGSASCYHPVLNEFDYYFSGGMLWTCGLKNTGPDYIDEDGFFQHAHGRIGITPCESSYNRTYWQDEDLKIISGGIVRESLLGGHNLILNRAIETSLSRNEIVINDVLENNEPQGTEYLILYHFNFGFPFLSESLELNFPESKSEIIPRTEEASEGLSEWSVFKEPADGSSEHVFFHKPVMDDDGCCEVRLENKILGIGAYLRYESENLPILTQWKTIRACEYALGIEPGNSYISGMKNERKTGNVGFIKGFSEKRFSMKLGFYDL